MNWLGRLARRQKLEQQLDAELRFHMDERLADLRKAGLTDQEARRQLRWEFGGADEVKEACRDARGTRWLEEFWSDLRYAARTLGAAPGFTATCVLTLAFCFGANSAVFSVIDAILIRPLPYAAPERLVALAETNRDRNPISIAYPNFEDWRAQSRSFTQIAGYQPAALNVADAQDRPERIPCARVTPNFLATLGTQPLMGRDFLPSDAGAGAGSVALLTSKYWHRRFAGDPGVLGKSILVNFRAYTIIGVLPPSFRFLSDAELFLPLGARNGDRGDHNGLYGIGRLAPGAGIEQARAELTSIAQRLAAAYPGTNSGQGASVEPLQKSLAGRSRAISLILFAAVLVVLLIGCANMANLLLARNVTRQREISVRLALGAGRFRLIRQLLAESLLISLLGGAAGLALAYGSLGALAALVPVNIRHFRPVTLNGSALAYTAISALVAALLFGLLPALTTLYARGPASLHVVNRGSRGAPGQSRMRRILLISEFALALMLLVCGGLVSRSFWNLTRVNPGFTSENVLQMRVVYPNPKYGEDEARVRAFYADVLHRVEQLPGVERAAAVFCPPLGGGCWGAVFSVAGQPSSRAEAPSGRFNVVAGDYFGALGVPLLSGRTFWERDYLQARPIAVVNETLARRIWPGQNPLGRRIKIGWPAEGPGEWLEIVGVVADIQRDALADPPAMEAYLMHTAVSRSSMQLIVRTRPEPASLATAVRQAVWAGEKDALIYDVGTMEQRLAESVAPRRLDSQLLGAFAALALLLATVGVSGLIAFAVSQRKSEIAVRVALGARSSDVLRLIVGEGLRLVLAGVALGLVAALLVTRALGDFLFGVTATDPLTFIVVPILLTAVALAASYFPARSALRIDPATTLHSD